MAINKSGTFWVQTCRNGLDLSRRLGRLSSLKQLRLFPYENPLSLRFGNEFCREIPKSPGVYFMYDEQGTVIYVGKAINLNQRLRSYFYQKPENSSRKTIQLVSQIFQIRWQPEVNETEALLKENESIRKYKPQFNVLNKDFHTYPFQHLGLIENQIEMKISFRQDPEPLSHVFGCFRSRGLTLRTQLAIARLLHVHETGALTLHALPKILFKNRIEKPIRISPRDPNLFFKHLKRFYEGKSNYLSETFQPTLEEPALHLCLRKCIEQDLETLETFYKRSARSQKRMMKALGNKGSVIKQTGIDDERVRYFAMSEIRERNKGAL